MFLKHAVGLDRFAAPIAINVWPVEYIGKAGRENMMYD